MMHDQNNCGSHCQHLGHEPVYNGSEGPCGKAVVSVSNLSFAYGTDRVLENISFCVPDKCLVGVIGPNGGGKTTLMKLILGLLKPQVGTIDVFGKPALKLDHFNLRPSIGYVPQRLSLDWRFPATVWDVVISGCYSGVKMFHHVEQAQKSRAKELIGLVGASEFIDRPIGQLSGGQQRRVFIARALVSDPKLLVVDEPTSGVDTAGQIQFFELIQKLRDELKLTMIMVSHNIGQLINNSDYLACLNRRLHWHDSSVGLDLHLIEEIYGCELRSYLKGEEGKRDDRHMNEETT